MKRDLEDSGNGVVRITADNVCCVDRGNDYDVAKNKREEAVATSLFLISSHIAQSTNNIITTAALVILLLILLLLLLLLLLLRLQCYFIAFCASLL